MPTPFDVYTDSVFATISPYGAVINLSLSSPIPAEFGGTPEGRLLGSVRMSVPCMKAMTFMFRRLILSTEASQGFPADVSLSALNKLGIAPEDWTAFWKVK